MQRSLETTVSLEIYKARRWAIVDKQKIGIPSSKNAISSRESNSYILRLTHVGLVREDLACVLCICVVVRFFLLSRNISQSELWSVVVVARDFWHMRANVIMLYISRSSSSSSSLEEFVCAECIGDKLPHYPSAWHSMSFQDVRAPLHHLPYFTAAVHRSLKL